MSYLCKYGHIHRTEKGVLFCLVNTPWIKKRDLITKTPYQKKGTTEVWSELGDFRDLFWSGMRDRIVIRDKICQYKNCHNNTHNLEVHHIIPRRHGGSDHPTNLITLCHNHHRIQSSHHHDVGLILCDADREIIKNKYIRRARPCNERTLKDFNLSF